MKKLFILTLLVFSTAVCVFATSSSVKTYLKTAFIKPPVVKIKIKLGSLYDDCYGFSLCFVTSSNGRITSYINNEAGGSAYFENGILYIEISKSQLGQLAKDNLTKNKIIPIDADLTIDDETSTALQSSKSITILQGSYPIRDNGTSYTIAINCR